MTRKKDKPSEEAARDLARPGARVIYSGDIPKHKTPAGVLLRLPRSLHKKLKAQAYEEGVPMAQHILRCLAEASKAVEMGHQIGVVNVDEDTVPVTALPTAKAKKEQRKKETAPAPEQAAAAPIEDDGGFTVEIEPEADPAAEF
jgi:hypothetical protein